MNLRIPMIVGLILILSSCENSSTQNKEVWKAEIIDTEKRFSDMSVEKGVSEAFLAFAADDAVLMRNNNLVIGIQAIRTRFNNSNPDPTAKLSWKPDFVDVSDSGDLGYTYGPYTYTYIDSLGVERTNTGIFHTVWKRQADGNWKFVWD